MKVIQIVQGDVSRYQETIDKVKKSAINYGHDYELVTLDGEYNYAEHEMKRFELAIETPDMIYVDGDCEVLDWSLIPTDNPAFGFFKGTPDTFLFSVNGDTELFEKIIAEKKRRKIQDVYGWPRKILRELLKISEEIPSEAYIHEMVSYNKLTLKGKANGKPRN